MPFAAAALVLVILDGRGAVAGFRGFLEQGVAGIRQMSEVTNRVVMYPLSYWQYLDGGVKKVADLEQRLKLASVDYVNFKALEEENQQLKQLLNQKPSTIQEPFTAGAMLQGSHQAVLNKGLFEGVKTGSVVVNPEGTLVGRVKLARPHVSLVERPQDSSSRIAVRISGQPSSGVLVGRGDKAVLEGVLQSEPLKTGDVVVTSGTDDVYPPDMMVGIVTEITSQAADVTKTAEVELLKNAVSVKVYE